MARHAERKDETGPGTVSRTFWLGSTAAMVLVQVAHMAFRQRLWTIDTEWAVSEYLFSMIFFGPLVAALAAWQGRALSRSSWLMRGHPQRATRDFIGPLLALAFAVFISGLVATTLIALRTGAPLSLAPGSLADVAIALLAIAGYGSTGLALGFRAPFKATPAGVLALTFAVTLAGWVLGLESVFRFGGATGGVVGIEIADPVRCLRVCFWLALTLTALAWVQKALAPSRARSTVAVVSAAALLSSMIVGTTFDTVYSATRVTWACAGEGPEVCVPQKFTFLMDRLDAAVRDQGIPSLLVEASSHTRRVLEVSDVFTFAALAAAPGDARDSEVRLRVGIDSQAMFAPGCLPATQAALLTADQQATAEALFNWIMRESAYTGSIESDPGDGLPRGGVDSDAARAWVSQNLDALPSCES